MRVAIEYRPEILAYNIWFISDKSYGDRMRGYIDSDGWLTWETVDEGVLPEPTLQLSESLFHLLFDSMKEQVTDYGNPDEVALSTLRREQDRVDKFIDYLTAPMPLLGVTREDE